MFVIGDALAPPASQGPFDESLPTAKRASFAVLRLPVVITLMASEIIAMVPWLLPLYP